MKCRVAVCMYSILILVISIGCATIQHDLDSMKKSRNGSDNQCLKQTPNPFCILSRMSIWLQDFSYRTRLSISVFILSAMSAFAIPWFTVSFQRSVQLERIL